MCVYRYSQRATCHITYEKHIVLTEVHLIAAV